MFFINMQVEFVNADRCGTSDQDVPQDKVQDGKHMEMFPFLLQSCAVTAAESQHNIMYRTPMLCMLPTDKIGSEFTFKTFTGVEKPKTAELI